MDKELLLLCKSGLQTVVLKLGCDVDFEVLVRRLCENWNFDDGCNVRLSYSVSGHCNCLLRNDDDLMSMRTLVGCLGLKFVDIEVSVIVDPLVNESNKDDQSSRSSSVCGGPSLCETATLTPDNIAVLKSDSVESALVSDSEYSELTVVSQVPVNMFPMSSGWSLLLRHVNQIFVGGVDEFRCSLAKFAYANGFKFCYGRNSKAAVQAYCSMKLDYGCTWKVSGSTNKTNGFFYVKVFQSSHNHDLSLAECETQQFSFNLISELVLDQVRRNINYSAGDVVAYMKVSYGIDIEYKPAWRALEKAKGIVFGDEDASFNRLRFYVDSALSSNPGSSIVLHVDSVSRRFQRIFVSFNGSIQGFRFCRPMLFVDGTFAKGKYKGTILCAIAKDGNQGMFPVAFGVVDAEDSDNWQWFLVELQRCIGNERQITIVSDRHPGLLFAVPIVFAGSQHLFCLQHLKNNLRSRFSGGSYSNKFRESMVWNFQRCAYAKTRTSCQEILGWLLAKGGGLFESFLAEIPLQTWANAYLHVCRYGELTSNAAECFNSWIDDARRMPILQLVDTIRTKIMTLHAVRRDKADNWDGLLCPKMTKRLNENVEHGRVWNLKKCSDYIYEIMCSPSISVDLRARTCSCNGWQIDGFPCLHATAAIVKSGFPLVDFVEHYFIADSYRKTYEHRINPVLMSEDSAFVEREIVLPPLTKRPAGRPKKIRIRSRGEQVKMIYCSRCHKLGRHNRKTCKVALK